MHLKWGRIIIGIACIVMVSLPAAAQRQGITSRMLLQTTTTEAGQPLAFPQFRNEITAMRIEVDPGGRTGVVRVQAPAVGYVLEGSVSMERDGQPPKMVPAGQAVAVPLNSPLAFANRGTVATRLLIVFFGEARKPHAVSQPSVTSGVRTTVVLDTSKTVTGEPILFPTFANQFLVVIAEFAPGAINPYHAHRHTVFAYILDGALTMKPDGLPPKTLRQGDAGVEPLIPHVGSAPAAMRAQFLVIFVGEAGTPPTTYLPQP